MTMKSGKIDKGIQTTNTIASPDKHIYSSRGKWRTVIVLIYKGFLSSCLSVFSGRKKKVLII